MESMDHSHHMDHSNHNMEHSTLSTMHSFLESNVTNVSMISRTEAVHQHVGMEMMIMYFHVGFTEYILFKSWHTESVGDMVGACFGIFLLAVAYEGLKVFREHLLRKSKVGVQYNSVSSTAPDGFLVTETHKTVQHQMLSGSHILQSALQIVQVICSYFLMLIFMTYNVWLCLAVALGSGVGYFAFGWKKSIIIDITEHCH